jgi:chromosome segregation ATPase
MTAQPDGWQRQAEHLTFTHTAVGIAAMAVAEKTRRRPSLKLVTKHPRTVDTEIERGLETSKLEVVNDLKPTRERLVEQNSALARAEKRIRFLVERIAQLDQHVPREPAATRILNENVKRPVAEAAAANKRVSELEDELGSLREGLVHWQNENCSLRVSLDLIVGENSRLSRCLTESDAADRRIAELDNDLRLAREGLVYWQNENRSLKASLDSVVSENSRLSRCLTESEVAVADKQVLERELAAAREGLDHWENKSRSFRASLDLILNEKSGLSRRLMESDIAAATRGVLERELGLAREELIHSQNRNRSLQASFNLIISEISRLSGRLTERDAAAHRARSQLEEMKAALTIALTTAEAEHNKLAAAVDEVNEKRQAEFNTLNTRLELTLSRAVAAEKLLAEARQSWLLRIDENSTAERKVADAAHARNATDKKLELLQNSLQIKMREVHDLEQSRLKLLEATNTFTKGFKTRAAALARAKRRINFLVRRVAQLEADTGVAKSHEELVECDSSLRRGRIAHNVAEAEQRPDLDAYVRRDYRYSKQAQSPSTKTLLADTITF